MSDLSPNTMLAPQSRAEAPAEVVVRIDRLLVETEYAVNAFALQHALADAVRELIADRGHPPAWDHDSQTPSSVIDGFVWDGHGGEPGLARVLATSLYEQALSAGGAR